MGFSKRAKPIPFSALVFQQVSVSILSHSDSISGADFSPDDGNDDVSITVDLSSLSSFFFRIRVSVYHNTPEFCVRFHPSEILRVIGERDGTCLCLCVIWSRKSRLFLDILRSYKGKELTIWQLLILEKSNLKN